MKKVGLALSGGGARGLAHIGVIKTLVKNNVPIDIISGTSIGALVGGLYAATKNINILEEIALTNNWKEIFNLFFDPGFKGGLITGNKIINLIEKYTGKIDFKDLKIPFVSVATDFNTGQMVEISKGKLCRAIRASIAVPFFFQPLIIDNKILFDGGLSSPYPVNSLRKMGADVVIGVNLYDDYLSELSINEINLIPVLRQSMKILLHNLAEIEAIKADVNITPSITKIGWKQLLTRIGSQQGIDIGVKAAEEKIEEINRLLREDKDNFFMKLMRFLIPRPHDRQKQNVGP